MEEKTLTPDEYAEKMRGARDERAARVALATPKKNGNSNRFNLPRSTTLPMLVALTVTGKHLYAGTVDPVEVRKRRTKNRVARRQRRVNRLRGSRRGVR